VMLHSRVALVTISPYAAPNTPQANAHNGPTLFIGLLGSCSRTNNTAHVICTDSSISPTYNTSVLPSNTATGVLTPPPAFITVLIAVAIGMLFIFFVGYSAIAALHITGSYDGAKDALDGPNIQKTTAGMGLFGFLLGLLCWLIVRLWLAKAIDDFNKSIVSPSKNETELAATAGNGFIMVWIAYAFYAIPLVAWLSKITHSSEPDADASTEAANLEASKIQTAKLQAAYNANVNRPWGGTAYRSY